jgi:hypothetical protein
VHLLLIAVLCLLAYSNTFDAPFQFDDISSIETAKNFHSNVLIRRSISRLTLTLNYRLHGMDVTGYHVVNLAIHILNALLVYSLAMLAFRTPLMESSASREKARHISLLAALLFACHPVQTQAVTYIVQRMASLATLFYLLSLVFYIRYRLAPSGFARRASLYVFSIVSIFLAMKSKEMTFTLPFAIVMCEFLFFRDTFIKRVLNLMHAVQGNSHLPAAVFPSNKPEPGLRLSDLQVLT